jgi:hypothetical protein
MTKYTAEYCHDNHVSIIIRDENTFKKIKKEFTKEIGNYWEVLKFSKSDSFYRFYKTPSTPYARGASHTTYKNSHVLTCKEEIDASQFQFTESKAVSNIPKWMIWGGPETRKLIEFLDCNTNVKTNRLTGENYTRLYGNFDNGSIIVNLGLHKEKLLQEGYVLYTDHNTIKNFYSNINNNETQSEITTNKGATRSCAIRSYCEESKTASAVRSSGNRISISRSYPKIRKSLLKGTIQHTGDS